MIPNDMITFSLSELCEIKYGKDHKKLSDGKVPVYGTGGIMRYVDSYLYDKKSVLIPRKGTLSNIFFVNERFWTVDTLFWTKIKEDIISPKFLYYKLLTVDFSAMNVGSAVPSLTTELLNRIKLEIPTLLEQRAIANILSSFDEKIDMNNKINKNLEDLAQTIYKRWFVDFEFPNEDGEPYKSSSGIMSESELGLIPKEWQIKTIGDYVTVKSGYAFKSSWWTDKGANVIKIKDLDNVMVDINKLDKVDNKHTIKANDFMVTRGDLLIAMTGATIGKIGLITSSKRNIYVNQRVGKFFLGNSPVDKLPYLHSMMRDKRIIDNIKSAGVGSAQPNISPTGIMSIKIPFKSEIIKEFNSNLKNIYLYYMNNIEENKTLKSLRDELLPKLMNGEIEVPIEG